LLRLGSQFGQRAGRHGGEVEFVDLGNEPAALDPGVLQECFDKVQQAAR
jgi:hypothetical protein